MYAIIEACGKQYIMKYRGKIPCCSKECTAKLKSIHIKNYLINNPRKKAKKLSYFEKTGYEKPMLNPEVRPKIIAKIKKTKQTLLKKYGTENPAKIPEIKEKIKQNNLKKYGVEFTTQLLSVKEKIRKTNLKKIWCKLYF